MKIAAKEADEADYWLLLCERSKTYSEIGTLSIQLQSIIKVLSKIISTTKNKVKY
jgi:four helix bundle protein